MQLQVPNLLLFSILGPHTFFMVHKSGLGLSLPKKHFGILECLASVFLPLTTDRVDQKRNESLPTPHLVSTIAPKF